MEWDLRQDIKFRPQNFGIKNALIQNEMQYNNLKLGLIFFFVLIILSFSFKLTAQEARIDVSGSWSVTIDETDLVAGAGSDLNSTYTSETNQITVNVDKIVYGNFWDWFVYYNWRVDVRRSDINWDSNFRLYVRRTGSGFGFGSISGGTSFQEVTLVDQTFFSGSRRRYYIYLQLQLENVSINISPDTYNTTVIYTVTEL